MINYETLKELALVFAKITGYRYVAFCKAETGDLFITFSDSEMLWREQKALFPLGVWDDDMDCGVLPVQDLPNLNWSKCQFDCEEADNEEEV